MSKHHCQQLIVSFILLLIPIMPIHAQDSRNAIPISIGDIATGEINGAADVYRFEASAGHVLIVDVMSEDFRPVVDVHGPDGNEILFRSEGETLASAAFVVPRDGIYTFFAGGFINRGEGQYTVRLRQASVIEHQDQLADQLDGGANAYTVTSAANGLAAITLEPLEDDLDLELTFISDANVELARTALISDRPGTITFPVAAGRTYAVVVDFWFASDRLTGSFRLSLDIIQPQPLFIDTPYAAEVSDFAVQYFTFEATAGETVHITADSGSRPGIEGVDTQLELIAPDGTRIARDSSNGPYLNPAITRVTLPQDGRYHVILQPEGDRVGSGSVDLLVESAEPYNLSTGQVTVTLGERFDQEVIRFDAEPGVHYRLRISPEAQSVEINIEIEGETFDTIDLTADNISRLVFDFTLPDEAQPEQANIHLRQYAPNEPILYNVALETVE